MRERTYELRELAGVILEQLPLVGVRPFADIADELDDLPWDVLRACRELVRTGLAREGWGKDRGSFGRVG